MPVHPVAATSMVALLATVWASALGAQPIEGSLITVAGVQGARSCASRVCIVP